MRASSFVVGVRVLKVSGGAVWSRSVVRARRRQELSVLERRGRMRAWECVLRMWWLL